MYDFLSQQNFCRDKHYTSFCHYKTCLLWQQNDACCDKIMFVMTNMLQQNFCHDKLTVIVTNMFLS